jgi:hypothetical protein
LLKTFIYVFWGSESIVYIKLYNVILLGYTDCLLM